MVHKLLAGFLKCSGALALLLLVTVNAGLTNSTEYVFSAPPEVDNELADIPTSETDYPLYECNNEQEVPTEEKAQAEENVIDSHNCECIDCENATQNNSEQNDKFSSKK